jgi:hypothetical protein
MTRSVSASDGGPLGGGGLTLAGWIATGGGDGATYSSWTMSTRLPAQAQREQQIRNTQAIRQEKELGKVSPFGWFSDQAFLHIIFFPASSLLSLPKFALQYNFHVINDKNMR